MKKWRKDPQRNLNASPTPQDPDSCRHNGGSVSDWQDGLWVTQCTECDSTIATRKP